MRSDGASTPPPPPAAAGYDGTARSAFTLSVVHQRKDSRRITAVALLKAGQRVFLGLDNGVVEEHRCSTVTSHAHAAGGVGGSSAAVLRLQAEKKVFSRQGVADISPADAAARLVVLSEEGQVALVSLETFAVVPLPAARGALCVAAQASSHHLPVLLAAAVKAGVGGGGGVGGGANRGRSKVLLFSVLPGATTTGSSKEPAVLVFQVPVPDTVTSLTWAGNSLLCAAPDGYYVLRPLLPHQHSMAQHGGGGGLSSPTAGAGTAGGMQWQLCLLADHLVSTRTLLGCIPDLGLGLMAWEDNMVLVTDAAGAAVREPLQLPLPPLALTSAGLFVVAICDDGVYAFDRSSSRQVQQIEYAHDDAYVGLAQRLPAAADAGGRCICLATSSEVLWLEPVALEQQVRELLKRKRFDQALDLIASSTSDPHSAPTTPVGATSTAAAAAAAAAARSLFCCSAAAAAAASSDSPIAAAAVAAVAAAAVAAMARGGGGGPSWQQLALAQAGLLLLLDADFAGGLCVLGQLPLEVWQPCQLFSLFPGLMARWLPKTPTRSYWGLHGQRLPELHTLIHDAVELRLATTPRHLLQLQQQQQQQGIGQQHLLSLPTGLSPAELQGFVQQAKTLIATHLTQMRLRPGLMHADGVDTLLLHLLCDVGDAAAVEALLSGPHAAAAAGAGGDDGDSGGGVDAALRAAGRWHALALLQLHAGQHKAALDTWKALCSGDLVESPSSTGAVAEAGGDAAAVAVAAVAAAMSVTADGPAKVPLSLLLEGGGGLQWLLERDAAGSLLVLEARGDLPTDTVLQLLQGCDADLQWQYLYHQVYHNSSSHHQQQQGQQQQLHTQLGQVMLAAIAKYLPTQTNSSSSGDGGVGVEGVVHSDSTAQQQHQLLLTAPQLADMVQQLPLLFAPNAPVTDSSAAAAQLGAGLATVASSSSSSRGNTDALFASASGAAAAAGIGGGGGGSSYFGGFQPSAGAAAAANTSTYSRQHSGANSSSMLAAAGGGQVMPSASMLAASVSVLHRRASSSTQQQQVSVAAIDAAVAAAAAAGGSVAARASQHNQTHHQQQQYAQLATVHERQQHQQHHHYGSFGVLAGRPVQPQQHRQRLQQQQQGGLSAHGGLLSLSGGTPSGAAAAHSKQQHYHQQYQQQQHQHQGGVSRQLSSIAELLLQQHQEQQQYVGGGGSSSHAGGSVQHQQQHVSTSGVKAAATTTGQLQQQQQQPFGIRVLPPGFGPWPVKPHPAAAGAGAAQLASSSSRAASSSQLLVQEAAGGSGVGGTAVAAQEQQRDVAGGGGVSSPFAAAAASAAVQDKVLLLRCLLVYHLQASLLYDSQVLLSAAQALPLYPELYLMHSRAGHHTAALLLLALMPPRLVEGAISYCRALNSQEAWISLLELFLSPKSALAPQNPALPLELYPAAAAELAHVEPDYGSACRVLNAEGAALNPLKLLGSLPAGMPLHLAGNVLSRMLSGLQHRHRQGQIVRSLQRCRQLSSHAELVELQAGRVLLTDDTACHGCGRLIGSKVFVRLPSGVVMCSRCSGAVGSLAAASTTRQ